MAIKPINHYSFTAHPSVIDEEALTALELASRTASKVNEVVDDQNKHREHVEKLTDEMDDKIKQLFEEDLAKHVNLWLEAHPEVTTTVQDNELGVQKLTPEARAKTVKDYVTPLMYEGTDTQRLTACMDSGKDVFIPAGTYNITGTLNIPNGVRVWGEVGKTILNIDCDTLFNVSSYYTAAPTIEGLKITANQRKALLCNSGTWGCSVKLKDIRITGAGKWVIQLADCFNVEFDNVQIDTHANAEGAITLVHLSAGGTSFSNLISIKNSVFVGKADQTINLINTDNAQDVKLYNCTFENFATAIIGNVNAYACWFENGNLAIDGKNSEVYGAHYANVTAYQKTSAGTSINRTPLNFNMPMFANGADLDSSVFALDESLAALRAGGYNDNGTYTEFRAVDWRGGSMIVNVPVNMSYRVTDKKGEFTLYPPKVHSIAKGTFLVTVNLYRIGTGNALVAHSRFTGILVNNAWTLFTSEHSDEYPGALGWNNANTVFSASEWHDGTCHAILELRRLSMT